MSPRNKFIIFLTAIVGVVLLLAVIFGGSGSKKDQPAKPSKPTPAKPVILTDYANRDSSVIFTTDGQINSDEQHHAIRITVTRFSKTVEVIQGYQGTVIKTQRYSNNPAAYDVFIRTLARAGYGKKRTTAQTDERGVCPNGSRYIAELKDNNDQIFRLWSGSCGGGTSAVSAPAIQALFQKQIPDYSTVVGSVQL